LNVLLYFRGKRVIHRDLKLSNIFLQSDMTLRVGDFGMAIILDNYDEKRTTFCGTPNYLSPEAIDNFSGYSFDVDNWAFAVLLYTMLIGHGPFEAPTVKEIFQKVKLV